MDSGKPLPSFSAAPKALFLQFPISKYGGSYFLFYLLHFLTDTNQLIDPKFDDIDAVDEEVKRLRDIFDVKKQQNFKTNGLKGNPQMGTTMS